MASWGAAATVGSSVTGAVVRREGTAGGAMMTGLPGVEEPGVVQPGVEAPGEERLGVAATAGSSAMVGAAGAGGARVAGPMWPAVG